MSAPRARRSRLVRDAGLGALVLGLLAALAWVRLAPEVVATTVAGGGASVDADAVGGLFGQQAVLGVVLAAAGAVLGTVVVLRVRDLGPDVPVVLVVAGVLGAVLAWQVGIRLGPSAPETATLAEGTPVALPLDLDAPGVLALWPIASLVVLLVGTALTRR